jgi:hypothetical protein
MFMCKRHWFSLRKPLRDAIWREYRPGQENDKKPSLRYLCVQQRAIGELIFKPNDEAAALLAAPYLIRSHDYRRKAVADGGGDPLEGVAPWPESGLPKPGEGRNW